MPCGLVVHDITLYALGAFFLTVHGPAAHGPNACGPAAAFLPLHPCSYGTVWQESQVARGEDAEVRLCDALRWGALGVLHMPRGTLWSSHSQGADRTSRMSH